MRERQAELARAHGIYGFCYYFYWFGGRRLLETPLALMLADGAPDLPFCLCWANEPWSRRWDGRERDILMPQHHDRVRDLAILDDLMPFFEDERYIRIDGRPLLLIYRQGLLDDPVRFTRDLRQRPAGGGFPGLYLCNVMSIGDSERVAAGFDAAVEFPPNGILVTEIDARTARGRPGVPRTDLRLLVSRDVRHRASDSLVPVLPGRHASLGQFRAQGHGGADLQRLHPRALRALAAPCRQYLGQKESRRASRLRQLLERVG